MKRKKNKTLRRTLGFIALVLVVALLAAMPLLASGKAPEEEYPLSILSARAQRQTIDRFLCGGGSLQQGDGQSVTVPVEVKLTEFLVENGDTVCAGDPIAKVDRVSVMSAIAATQEAMEQLEEELETARKDSSATGITAPGGLVKKVYAQSGDSVADVMVEHGALAVISLDGLMAVQITADCTLAAGDKLDVAIAGETVEGTVKLNRNGELTVTVPDRNYEEGQTAVLTAGDGTFLGEGTLCIHAPWHAVAYSGTVGTVYAREGSTLYSGATVLTLKDMGYSAEYRSLARQHREYEEQMMELFLLYQSLTLTAPCDGVVSGIDEESPQLLNARGGWQVTLLANEPNGDSTQSYYNFVAQVLYIHPEEGYAILRVNPQFYPVSDYADLSGIPRDTAAMTDLVETQLSAPVYVWKTAGETPEDTAPPAPPTEPGTQPPENPDSQPGEETEPAETPEPTQSEPTQPSGESQEGSWTQSGYTAGGIYLFSGNSGGQLVWAVEIGYQEIPNLDIQLPGLPSYGGMGGLGGFSYGGYGSQQPEQTQNPQEATVALVTPTDTMTVDIIIDELDLYKVALGQKVNVTVDALVGAGFEGTVTKIAQAGENSGGSSKFTVTVTLAREEDMLSGMNAAVTIPLGQEEGIAVPLAALYQEKNRTLVYTAQDEKTGQPTAPVTVVTGLADGENVLVTGLEEGTKVYYGYYEALENDSIFAPPTP